MKNILVTGAYGQLGNEIRIFSANYPQYGFIFTDVDTLDICDLEAIEKIVSSNNVAYIINCAAYTAVDKAEDNEDLCRKLNADAPENLGKAANKYKAGIIHVSTDYVFDGSSNIPYTEDMKTCPASVYGKTKREGEEKLMAVCQKSFVIRTAWLYSEFGNNFVKTMIKLGKERKTLSVVFDQIGTPTYAADLAKAILQIMDYAIKNENDNKYGIYHYTNEGVCSWYDFTLKIHELSNITSCKVSPIESKDYPAKAPRPYYSVLNKSKIKQTFGIAIPHWEDGLKRCLKGLI